MNDGWIKLYRKSYDNFLYKEHRPHTKREAWEDILLNVNYEDEMCTIGNQQLECKRGQSLLSLESWGKIFNWDKSKVKRFFDVLSREGMIDTQNDTQMTRKTTRKTTHLTVLKYEDYQGDRNTDETQMKRKTKHKCTPIKEEEEGKEEKNTNHIWRKDFKIYLDECKNGFKQFIEDKELMKEQRRLNPGLNLDLTLEKSFKNYWGIETGWKNKKASKTVNIDWKQTIINAIGNKINRVYESK
jgi:hypothetical protein